MKWKDSSVAWVPLKTPKNCWGAIDTVAVNINMKLYYCDIFKWTFCLFCSLIPVVSDRVESHIWSAITRIRN
jgi:hypothetical protein